MTNSMAIGAYGYDPYFMQAYNSPNYYAQLAQTQTQTAATNQTNTSTNTNTNTTANAVNFKGAADSIKEEKSSNTAKWILGTLATIGTVYLGYKCHGKGIGENWYSKVWDGAKQYWNKAVETIGKWTVKTNVNRQQTLALPARWTRSYRGFEFSIENGKVVKCMRNGVEYVFNNLPQAFRNSALKAIGLA